MIGSALVSALEAEGNAVRQLVRRAATDQEREICWDPTRGEIEAEKLRGIDAVVHLAGSTVAARWTDRVKQEIRDSRVKSTELLAGALAGLDQKPSVLCTASAIGIYGDRGAEVLDEQSPPGQGFLADVCQQWEAASRAAWEAGIRVVQVRIGMVLSPAGGALQKMLPAFKLGMGGVMGSGEQFVSWIALDDVVRGIQHVVHNDAVHGAVNLVAPEPVTNVHFTKIGEMADELLLASTRVAPRRLQEAGYQFQYPELAAALRHLLASH
jgi:uncharacterized protein (TIGR01777 family)